MKNLIKLLLLTVTVKLVASESPNEMAQACIANQLIEKNILDPDFPLSVQPVGCGLVSIVISSMENGFYTKFDNVDSINAPCVKNELKERNFMDYIMKKEVVEMSKKLPFDQIRVMLNKNKEDLKNVLNGAAMACNSDLAWGGIFDDILGLKNTSHAVLERDYCYLKISLDENLVDLGDIDRNPGNLDTSTIDCDKVVSNRKAEIESQLRKKYSEMGISGNKADCVLDKLNERKFVDTTIALETLERLDLDPSVRARNKNKLSESLQAGIMGIINCLM